MYIVLSWPDYHVDCENIVDYDCYRLGAFARDGFLTESMNGVTFVPHLDSKQLNQVTKLVDATI